MKTDAARRRRNDLILILSAAALAVICLLVFRSQKAGDGCAVVRIDGAVTASYPLSEDVTVTVAGADGGENVLVIRDGKADIVSADCPDKLCVHQPAVDRDGESIICLPHRVTVTVEGGSAAEVDAVAGGPSAGKDAPDSPE